MIAENNTAKPQSRVVSYEVQTCDQPWAELLVTP